MSLLIAGVDEVGRGPLAGAVVTAAVILQEPIPGITDSKKLTPLARCKLAELIKQKAIAFAYGRAEVEEIDKMNIHNATLLAMKRALNDLPLRPDKVWVDGLFIPQVDLPCEAVVNGDAIVYEIGAASILAKVARDAEMEELDQRYPGYGFRTHKGYATPMHQKALLELGPCAIHRKSFAPVAKLLDIANVDD